MKRGIFAAIAAFGILFGSQSQAVAQVEQGSILIDPYVGAPTWNIWWKSVIDVTQTGYKTLGSPVSFGGRFEYMVADNFGVGLDGNYAISGFSYEASNPDDTTGLGLQTLDYKANRFRIMVRLNYHFVQTEALDVYFGVGVGYRNIKRTIAYDGVDWTDNSSFSLLTSTVSFPLAFRLALGMRYYFIPNLGVHLELGSSGGGAIQGGIAVKF
jgi:opacity protein-like surface antigen